jgi:hypothetical protein
MERGGREGGREGRAPQTILMRSMGAAIVLEVTAAIPERRKFSTKLRGVPVFIPSSHLARPGMVAVLWRQVVWGWKVVGRWGV